MSKNQMLLYIQEQFFARRSFAAVVGQRHKLQSHRREWAWKFGKVRNPTEHARTLTNKTKTSTNEARIPTCEAGNSRAFSNTSDPTAIMMRFNNKWQDESKMLSSR